MLFYSTLNSEIRSTVYLSNTAHGLSQSCESFRVTSFMVVNNVKLIEIYSESFFFGCKGHFTRWILFLKHFKPFQNLINIEKINKTNSHIE